VRWPVRFSQFSARGQCLPGSRAGGHGATTRTKISRNYCMAQISAVAHCARCEPGETRTGGANLYCVYGMVAVRAGELKY